MHTSIRVHSHTNMSNLEVAKYLLGKIDPSRKDGVVYIDEDGRKMIALRLLEVKSYRWSSVVLLHADDLHFTIRFIPREWTSNMQSMQMRC